MMLQAFQSKEKNTPPDRIFQQHNCYHYYNDDLPTIDLKTYAYINLIFLFVKNVDIGFPLSVTKQALKHLISTGLGKWQSPICETPDKLTMSVPA